MREICHAQQHFVNTRAFGGVMERTWRYQFLNLAKQTPSSVNMKTLKNNWEYVFNASQLEISQWQWLTKIMRI